MIRAARHLRDSLRRRFFSALRHFASIDDTRQVFVDLLEQQNLRCNFNGPEWRYIGERPYTALGSRTDAPPVDGPRWSPVFVTARFRSGSTLVWNLFRSLPEVTAYYEPLNERRWFDPSTRGQRVDATHRGVDDYWAEYEGLEQLSQYYDESWTRRRLYMPADAWAPALEQYIRTLVEKAKGRAVLQFNRVDFRLAWLRSHFPYAVLLHVYRHPRDQWWSTLPHDRTVPLNVDLRGFRPYDGFYLLDWARDLQTYFPVLRLPDSAHPYELFYLVWRLSYAHGRAYSHLSISYEELSENPSTAIARMFSAASIDPALTSGVAGLVAPMPRERWRAYAPAEWFEEVERRVDAALDRSSGLLRNPAQ